MKYGMWKGIMSIGKDYSFEKDGQGNSQYKVDIWIT